MAKSIRKVLKERLAFKDFSLKNDAQEAILQAIADNFQKRMFVLKHAASEGDPTAKAMYLLLCEDFLKAFQNEYKSSRPYLATHELVVNALEELFSEQ